MFETNASPLGTTTTNSSQVSFGIPRIPSLVLFVKFHPSTTLCSDYFQIQNLNLELQILLSNSLGDTLTWTFLRHSNSILFACYPLHTCSLSCTQSCSFLFPSRCMVPISSNRTVSLLFFQLTIQFAVWTLVSFFPPVSLFLIPILLFASADLFSLTLIKNWNFTS